METKITLKHVPALDGIRGLAILLVVLYHLQTSSFWRPYLIPAPFERFIFNGWAGVDLFFVLSGFLIGGILMEHSKASNYYRTFYWRRACRILPAYALFVLIPLCFVDRTLPLWSYFTFTQNIPMALSRSFGDPMAGQTWSLAVEEQFYLLLPFLVCTLNRRWLVAVSVAFIVGATSLRFILLEMMHKSYVARYVLFPSRADSLFAGVLLAVAFKGEAMSWIQRNARPIRMLFVAALAMVIWGTVDKSSHATTFWDRWSHTLMAVFGVLLITVAHQQGIVSRVLSLSPLRYLGTISYGLYLTHSEILSVFPKLVPSLPGPVAFVAVIGVMLAVAVFSWHFLEKPIVRFGQRAKYDYSRAASWKWWGVPAGRAA
jgi:peptidoglycan/LPS O-acetylase OafA/YrhL